MTKKAKTIVTIALMLGMSLAALDTTIVGTALPSIVGKLGGIALYSWVFSIYLLTSTTTVPIYGKLADLYGRKPVFLFGSALFLLGSILCGSAQSMGELIIFRAIQGLGAGAVLPIVLTIIGDIFELQERARVQGLFSAVWGLASIVGPAVGGLIVDHFSWRWVFYINVPFGLLSGILLTLSLKETVERKKQKLDYLGTLTLTGSIIALLFALLQGGTNWSWLSVPSISLFTLFLVLIILFLRQESRASEPILPLTLFTNRIIAVSSLGG
ncbi:MAG: MFS transporter, partial [Chloroflexi bacterium]|nr:MFS transporter [Chloroflexota bacterium]